MHNGSRKGLNERWWGKAERVSLALRSEQSSIYFSQHFWRWICGCFLVAVSLVLYILIPVGIPNRYSSQPCLKMDFWMHFTGTLTRCWIPGTTLLPRFRPFLVSFTSIWIPWASCWCTFGHQKASFWLASCAVAVARAKSGSKGRRGPPFFRPKNLWFRWPVF